ncbi:uncharacterized protein AMSG_04326, partial [Thecamonas trahens ATCC 50062]
ELASGVTSASGMARDWNREYQTLVNSIDDSVILAEHKKFLRLASLARDFVYAAQTYGKVIIAEMGLPDEAKTIKPVAMGGIAGGVKYVVHGILFKFAIDASGVFNGNDEVAEKVASDEMRALQAVYNAHVPGLQLPLMVLINFRGFRLIASSQLPISDQTLVYGSSDAGSHIFNSDPEFADVMDALANKLLLRKHFAGPDPATAREIYGPADIEGHRGRDGALYMIDFARMFPLIPRLALSGLSPVQTKFRPELIKRVGIRVSSDAGTRFATPGPDADSCDNDILWLYIQLLDTVVPEVAASLDASAASRPAVMDPAIDDGPPPLRTILARDPELASPRGLAVRLRKAGVNLKFLATVRAAVTDPAWRLRILVEMVARAVHAELNARLRATMKKVKLPSEEPHRATVVNMLNLVFGASQQSRSFWDGQLSRSVSVRYPHIVISWTGSRKSGDIAVYERDGGDVPTGPALYEALVRDGLGLLLARVVDLAGIELVPSTYAAATTDTAIFTVPHPFAHTDIAALHARVQQLTIVSYAEGTLHFIQARNLARKTDERCTKEFTRIRDLARAHFESVLDVMDDPATLTNYGFLVEDLDKDHEAALRLYERAFTIDPNHARSLYYSAMVWERKKRDYDRAEHFYASAIAADPTHTNALKDFANFCHTRINDNTRARDLYTRAFASNPHHVKAAAMLAKFKLAVGDDVADVVDAVAAIETAVVASGYFAWVSAASSPRSSRRSSRMGIPPPPTPVPPPSAAAMTPRHTTNACCKGRLYSTKPGVLPS